MEISLWILVFLAIFVAAAAHELLKAIDRLLEEVRQTKAYLEPLQRINDSSDMYLREIQTDIYLIRRIAEEKGGMDKDAIYAADKKKHDAMFKKLEDLVRVRES